MANVRNELVMVESSTVSTRRRSRLLGIKYFHAKR